jgi:hypothetical protein
LETQPDYAANFGWQAGVVLSAFIARFKRRGAIAAQPSGDYTSPAGSCKGLPAPEKDGGVGACKTKALPSSSLMPMPFGIAYDAPQQVWLTSRIALPADGLAIKMISTHGSGNLLRFAEAFAQFAQIWRKSSLQFASPRVRQNSMYVVRSADR